MSAISNYIVGSSSHRTSANQHHSTSTEQSSQASPSDSAIQCVHSVHPSRRCLNPNCRSNADVGAYCSVCATYLFRHPGQPRSRSVAGPQVPPYSTTDTAAKQPARLCTDDQRDVTGGPYPPYMNARWTSLLEQATRSQSLPAPKVIAGTADRMCSNPSTGDILARRSAWSPTEGSTRGPDIPLSYVNARDNYVPRGTQPINMAKKLLGVRDRVHNSGSRFSQSRRRSLYGERIPVVAGQTGQSIPRHSRPSPLRHDSSSQTPVDQSFSTPVDTASLNKSSGMCIDTCANPSCDVIVLAGAPSRLCKTCQEYFARTNSLRPLQMVEDTRSESSLWAQPAMKDIPVASQELFGSEPTAISKFTSRTSAESLSPASIASPVLGECANPGCTNMVGLKGVTEGSACYCSSCIRQCKDYTPQEAPVTTHTQRERHTNVSQARAVEVREQPELPLSPAPDSPASSSQSIPPSVEEDKQPEMPLSPLQEKAEPFIPYEARCGNPNCGTTDVYGGSYSPDSNVLYCRFCAEYAKSHNGEPRPRRVVVQQAELFQLQKCETLTCPCYASTLYQTHVTGKRTLAMCRRCHNSVQPVKRCRTADHDIVIITLRK